VIVRSNTFLQARRIAVASDAKLRIGVSEENPARDVTIFLAHTSNLPDTLDGTITVLGTLDVFGEQKTEWTFLTSTVNSGSKSLRVDSCDGWSVGDELVLLPTGNTITGVNQKYFQSPMTSFKDPAKTSVVIIDAIDAGTCLVTTASPIPFIHLCDWVWGGTYKLCAEVLNMRRSVHITGNRYLNDPSNVMKGHNGIEIKAISTKAQMRIRYARVDKCGKVRIGGYCIHYHMIDACSNCFIHGVVVTESVNKGITVHGTHDVTLSRNVIYAHRGAFVYIEDGNERNILLKENVLACPNSNWGGDGPAPSGFSKLCSFNGIWEHRASSYDEQSGVYSLSNTINMEGNRIVNNENAVYFDYESGNTFGSGAARGKICASSRPFGYSKNEHYRFNTGFGWYVNKAFPVKISTDTLLYSKALWDQCLPYDFTTNEDRGSPIVIEGMEQLFSNFGAGTYDIGELTFKNSIFAGNLKGTYSKSYRRSSDTPPAFEGCTFINNMNIAESPGGAAHFEYKNCNIRFADTGFVMAHHCNLGGQLTGGNCVSHYDLRSARIDKGLERGITIRAEREFSRSRAAAVTLLPGGESVFLKDAFTTFDTATCVVDDTFMSCPFEVRAIRIYSFDLGDLSVRVHNANGDTYTTSVAYYSKDIGGGALAGSYQTLILYCNGDAACEDAVSTFTLSGYSFLVRPSAANPIVVDISSLSTTSVFVMEYAENTLESPPVTFNVNVGSLQVNSCTVDHTHSREYITPYGPLVPRTGLLKDCDANFAPDLRQAWLTGWNNHVNTKLVDIQWCNDPRSCDGISHASKVEFDSKCRQDPITGCNAMGRACCRFCDASPDPSVSYFRCDDRTKRSDD